jgi:hypothetical protein
MPGVEVDVAWHTRESLGEPLQQEESLRAGEVTTCACITLLLLMQPSEANWTACVTPYEAC